MNLPRLAKIIGMMIILVVVGYSVLSPRTAYAVVFTVDSLLDTPDASTDGVCDDGDGNCTLRAAIAETNAANTSDDINFSVTGTIVLDASLPDVTDIQGVTLIGPGPSQLELDASAVVVTPVLTLDTTDHTRLSGFSITNVGTIGILMVDGAGNRFTNISFEGDDGSDSSIMLRVNNSMTTRIENCIFTNAAYGIELNSSSNSSITGSSFSTISGDGILFIDSDTNTIDSNNFENVSDVAINIRNGSSYNIINANTISDNPGIALSIDGVGDDLEGSISNTISNNTMLRNTTGIQLLGDSGNTTIDTNTITDSGNGIYAESTTDLLVAGNTITGNDQDGIKIVDSEGVTIGSVEEGDRNVISGNGSSSPSANADIVITDTNDITVAGNYIGLDATGIENVSFSNNMILDGIGNAIIGGTTPEERNYFSAGDGSQSGQLLYLLGAVTGPLSITGNYFGLNIENAVVGGELVHGIFAQGDMNEVSIGGAATGEGNVISGMQGLPGDFGEFYGAITLANTEGIRIQGNKIGTDPLGVIRDGYGNRNGVVFGSVSIDNQIGGTSAGEGNIIAGNRVGILGFDTLNAENELFHSHRNAIVGNTIYGNTSGRGIDLLHLSVTGEMESIAFSFDERGYTENDTGDADEGANDYLNHPVITAIDEVSGAVTYSLDVPDGDYRIEFFKNPSGASDTGYGEGEVFLGFDTFSGSAGTQSKVFEIEEGDIITATITEDFGEGEFGSTSEFSNAFIVTIPTVTSAGSRLIGTHFTCTDPSAMNYERFGKSKPELCRYSDSASPVSVEKILSSGTCPASQIVTDNMRQGDTNGKYSAYNKKPVTQIAILQAHINRILAAQYNQAAGPVDGIFGPLTKQGVQRLQVALNNILKPDPLLKIDGIVGPFTRAAINNSCGGMNP